MNLIYPLNDQFIPVISSFTLPTLLLIEQKTLLKPLLLVSSVRQHADYDWTKMTQRHPSEILHLSESDLDPFVFQIR